MALCGAGWSSLFRRHEGSGHGPATHSDAAQQDNPMSYMLFLALWELGGRVQGDEGLRSNRNRCTPIREDYALKGAQRQESYIERRPEIRGQHIVTVFARSCEGTTSHPSSTRCLPGVPVVNKDRVNHLWRAVR